jgi:hypothetical protein
LSDDVTLETKGLDQLLKALKQSTPPNARVGILGDKNARSPAEGETPGPTNAEVGINYEFKLDPSRPGGSFLRVPISDRLQKEMESSGALDQDVMAAVIKQGTVLPWLKNVAALAEGIVLGAFDSCGYGLWKPSNMAHKKNAQTLVETQQLRDSVTSDVSGGAT